MEIQIKQTTDYPYDLLLLADPSREFVDKYLKTSDCFVAVFEQQPVGVAVVQKQSEDMVSYLLKEFEGTIRNRFGRTAYNAAIG